jgi:hypothetical protein
VDREPAVALVAVGDDLAVVDVVPDAEQAEAITATWTTTANAIS